MALLFSIKLETDYEAEYWRISDLRLDCSSFQILGTIELYKDAESRRAGKKPVDSSLFSYTIGREGWEEAIKSPISTAYNLIKAQTLQGGQDA